jgi:MFS family permease
LDTRPNLKEPRFAASAEDRKATLGIAAAIATISIVGVGLSLTFALISVRLEEAGFSARAIGLNSAAGGLATLAWAPFVPIFARRIGTRRILLLALIAGALSLAGFALTSDYLSWLLIRAFFGATLTTLFVISEYWINAIAPPNRRGLVMGLYTTMLAAGFAIGPLILLVTGVEGARPFMIGIALFMLATLPIALNQSAPQIETHTKIPVSGFLILMPIATLAALMHGAIETASMSLLPVYALRIHLGVEAGAAFLGLFLAGNMLFQIPIGLLSDRMDRRKLLFCVALGSLLGALALPLAASVNFSFFCTLLVIWGGLAGSFYAIGLALLGSRFSGAELASANAACVMFYSLGMLTGPPVVGFGLDLVTPNGFFLSVALLIAPYLGLVWHSLKHADS